MILFPERFAVRLHGEHRLSKPSEQLFDGFHAVRKAFSRAGEAIDRGDEYAKIAVRREEAAARLCLDIDFPGRMPVVCMESRALTRGGDLAWGGKWIEDEAPITARIMPDFALAYAWDEQDLAVYVDDAWPDLSGATALDEAFAGWQLRFEHADWEPTMPMLPGFDWDGFHEDGMNLAVRLKAMIGDRCEVLYEKPYEDPQRHVEEFRVIV